MWTRTPRKPCSGTGRQQIRTSHPRRTRSASCYREGVGVKEDDTEAVNWFRKAADQNDAAAQFNLGEMYEEGDGVKESMKEAIKWYRKASACGYAESIHADDVGV